MNSEFEKRSSAWEVGKGENTIVGTAIVFNSVTTLYTDAETGIEYHEVIERGALDNCDMSDVILRRDHAGAVLARTRNHSLNLTVDDKGLKIAADLSGSDAAKAMYQEVRSGLYDKMSFAFCVAADGDYYDTKTHTRHITAISVLQDVSIVDFPAYDATDVHCRSLTAAAVEDRKQFLKTEIRSMKNGAVAALDDLGFTYCKQMCSKDFPTREQRAAAAQHDAAEKVPALRGSWRNDYSLKDVIAGELLQLMEAEYRDVSSVKSAAEKIQRLQTEYLAEIAEKRSMLEAINRGEILPDRVLPDGNKNITTSEVNSMNTEVRNFYNQFIEKRAAGDTSTLTAMIPVEISENYILENAPDSMYAAASVTCIQNAGTVKIPIVGLRDVAVHAENAEVTAGNIAPTTLDITHSELYDMVGYSDLSWKTSDRSMESIVGSTLTGSMVKKCDGLCVNAVTGLTYDSTNSKAISGTAPTFAELLSVGSLLGADYLDGAKFYMNQATYFAWILPMTDTAGNVIFDASKPIEDIAIGGFHVVLDSQIPADSIYFGNPQRVHINFARQPELTSWVDYNCNQQKFSIRAVAGAAAEAGSFAKLYK